MLLHKEKAKIVRPRAAEPLSLPTTNRNGRAGVTVLNESEQVTVPIWVRDLASFRRWLEVPEVPDKSRIWYLKGEVWVDMSKEQVFSHVQVKTEYTVVVGGLVKRDQRGLYLVDGLALSNTEAGISGKPDGTFISTESLQSGQARLIEGKEEGFVEIEGTPDMVLEIISRSSVHKDKVVLRQAYWEARIPEYWLVDARQEPVEFQILRHTARSYVAARNQGGWIKSAVFGKSFRLTQRTRLAGHPEFILDVR